MNIAKPAFRSTLLLAAAFLMLPPSAMADAGDWLVRGRIIHVDPDNSNDSLSVVGLKGLSADSDTVPELDFTYFVSNNWALELILAVSDHDVKAGGALKAALGPGTAGIDSKALPPTLVLQYHFNPQGKYRPYAGLGVNYTHFFDEGSNSVLETALVDPSPSVEVDDSFGPAAQVGIDIEVNQSWFVNFDVKYIDIDADATIKSGGVKFKSDVDIDPIVWGVGVGYRF